jgi:hypothetical protein
MEIVLLGRKLQPCSQQHKQVYEKGSQAGFG